MTKFKTPDFWYKPEPDQIAKILVPLSRLYQFGHKLNLSRITERRASIPVICVGNLNAGGSGKTPTALALMELITKHNLALSPYFLTRGYGGKETGPSMVDLKKHNSRDVGDEALLLARKAATIVSRDRFKGAILATEKKAGCLLLDDGLQNPALMKDFSFVVIDGESGFGNGLSLPAGPLREPLSDGLARASAFIIIGEDKRNTSSLLPAGKPVLKASLKTTPLETGKRYLAFAGLGRPEKFKNLLTAMGGTICDWQAFPDHHPYTREELQKLMRDAYALNATLITTEKDFKRIPEEFHHGIEVLPVTLEFEEPNDVVALLSKILKP